MIEPHILFPAIAMLVLGVIWGTTWTLVHLECASSHDSAMAATREIVETYEAQVVRSVREIDQTLKYVKHACQTDHCSHVLQQFKADGLLPPNLIFSVAIADAQGNIVDSTGPVKTPNIAERDYFRNSRGTGNLVVGLPRRPTPSDEWRLRFVRRLDAPDGTFAGVVMVAVDSAYFVSGYETARMGNRGVLGLLGTDGVFRARRVGETIYAGDAVDYAALVPRASTAEPTVELQTNPWDGVRRYTAARELFNQNLAVVVGLSEDEQFSAAQGHIRSYLWFAAIASFIVALALSAMGYLSWQLAIDRRRSAKEKAVHAERVEHLAFHDSLTNLPNRRHFSLLFNQSIDLAKRRDERLGILFIDLDRFKEINDTLGHEAGDQLLKGVAARTRGCLREGDMVARLGGDEFVVLLPNAGADPLVAELAQRVLDALAAPFSLLGVESRITASIGISCFPDDGADSTTLTKSADRAMYAAKKAGKNRYCFNGACNGGPLA